MSAVQGEGQDVLTVEKLRVNFHTFAGEVKALDGVDLSVKRGEVLGLVGESGSGKSVTALSIEGLLPPNAEVAGGRIVLDGRNLLEEKKNELRSDRLTKMAMVFQDPLTYLNPVLTIGSQIVDILQTDRKAFAPLVVAARLEEFERTGRSRPLTEEEAREKARLGAQPAESVVGKAGVREAGEGLRRRNAGKGQTPRAREDIQDVSVRALRRDAPEDDNRDGAGQEAGPADSGRDYHRA